jgi:lipopolysaccharide O-acetyltransferase
MKIFNFIIQGFLRIYTYFYKRKFHFFGKNSIIKPFLNTFNPQYISIGDNVNIGSFCRITVSTEFGGKSCESKNKIRIKIGNNVDIGHNSFISGNNYIEIGDHSILAPYVFITDHDHGFENINKNLHEQPLTEGGKVIIEDNVFLGTKCSILKNVRIGRHSVIGANAVVVRDIPSYSVAVGNPAKVIKRYNFKKKRWEKVG